MGILRRKKGRAVFTAIYRDMDGIRREVSTGCKDKSAAKQVLADLERHAEKVRAGIVTRQEATAKEWANVPLSEHIAAHAAHMKGLGRAECTIDAQERLMKAVAEGCGWKRLAEMNRPQLEHWLNARISEGISARTRNAHAVAAIAFANWAVKAGRLALNPFAGLSRMNEQADKRRERRVLSMEEFGKLLEAAERRPLAERQENRGSQAKLSDATIDRLAWLGHTRAMVYRVLMFTGLRYAELRSITIAQMRLDASVPHIELRAADEKARRGAQVPLPAGLAGMLADSMQAPCRECWRGCCRVPRRL